MTNSLGYYMQRSRNFFFLVLSLEIANAVEMHSYCQTILSLISSYRAPNRVAAWALSLTLLD